MTSLKFTGKGEVKAYILTEIRHTVEVNRDISPQDDSRNALLMIIQISEV